MLLFLHNFCHISARVEVRYTATLSIGGIIGIVIAVLLVVGGIIAIFVVCCCCMNKKRAPAPAVGMQAPQPGMPVTQGPPETYEQGPDPGSSPPPYQQQPPQQTNSALVPVARGYP